MSVVSSTAEYSLPIVETPVAAGWNGSAWSSEAVTAPDGTDVSEMLADGCATGPFCAAVGDYVDSVGVTLALADTWTKAGWVTERPAQVPGARGTQLLGVSCPAAGVCEAVGDTTSGGLVAEGLSGGTWTLQSVPVPPNDSGDSGYSFADGSIESVSCVTADDCLAVGYESDNLGEVIPLTYSFNGSVWTDVFTTRPPDLDYDAILVSGRARPPMRAPGSVGRAPTTIRSPTRAPSS